MHTHMKQSMVYTKHSRDDAVTWEKFQSMDVANVIEFHRQKFIHNLAKYFRPSRDVSADDMTLSCDVTSMTTSGIVNVVVYSRNMFNWKTSDHYSDTIEIVIIDLD